MNTNSTGQKQQVASADDANPKEKKHYEKPDVRCEHVFETLALSCGKVQGTQGSCQHNRKTS